MKQFATILLMLILTLSAFSQDIITKKDGEDIKAKISEIDLTTVKYKKFENLSGPTYTILKSDILMIRYENGSKDIFKENTSQNQTNQTEQVKINQTENNSIKTYDITGFWRYPTSTNDGPLLDISKVNEKYTVKLYTNDNALKKNKFTVFTLANYYDVNNQLIVNKYKSNASEEYTLRDSISLDINSMYSKNMIFTYKKILSPFSQSNNTNLNNTNSSGITPNTSNNEEAQPKEKLTPFREGDGSGGVMCSFPESMFYLHVAMEQRISNSDLGIGMEGGMGSNTETGVGYNYFIYNVGVRGTYHIPIINNFFDPYVGSRVYYWWNKFDYTDSKIDDVKANDFDYDFIFGARIFVSKRFGFISEYHPRANMFYVGITFK